MRALLLAVLVLGACKRSPEEKQQARWTQEVNAAKDARPIDIPPAPTQAFEAVKKSTLKATVHTGDVRKLIKLDGVSGGNSLAFIVTEGMAHVGLPEIELANIPATSLKDAATLVNATAQMLLEQGDVTRDGEIDVDISKLTGDWHLDVVRKQGGSGSVTWKAGWAYVDPNGDKYSERVLELTAVGHGAAAENLLAAFDTYFGRHDDKAKTLDVDLEKELETAGEKAREELKKLVPTFAKGIAPDEVLSVKAPFSADGGVTEWMWVDVYKISATEIEGTLDNDPNAVKDLKAGSKVKVKLASIRDFNYRGTGGKRKAGGYSLDVFRKHGYDVPSDN